MLAAMVSKINAWIMAAALAMSLLAGPEEGFHVLRCRGDGSQVEIIVRKVRKREGKKSCYHLIQYKKRGLNYNTIIK